MSHGLGDMLTVCQGTCRQSRKAEIHTLLQRRYWRDETLAATLTQSSICISLIKERKKKKKKWLGAEEGRDDLAAAKKGIVRSGWGFPPWGRAALHLEASAQAHSPLSSPRVMFPCRLLQACGDCGIWLYPVRARWDFGVLYFSRGEFCTERQLSTDIFVIH